MAARTAGLRVCRGELRIRRLLLPSWSGGGPASATLGGRALPVQRSGEVFDFGGEVILTPGSTLRLEQGKRRS